ncbi:M23 family peptidase [Mobiluncus mulieris]|nr:M23 family peptidase [Mobiluncus mulieris]
MAIPSRFSSFPQPSPTPLYPQDRDSPLWLFLVYTQALDMKRILVFCLTLFLLGAPGVAFGTSSTVTPGSVITTTEFLYWPTGRPVPVPRRFDPPAQRWLPGHRGIDLRVTPGETVFAATDATVLYAGQLAGRPVVSLEDSSGRRYTYEPVEPSVSKDDEVSRGDPIGIALGGHYPGDNRLHFGVKDGRDGYVDPLELLGGRIRLWPLS